MKIRASVILLMVMVLFSPGLRVRAESLEGKTPSGILLEDLPGHIDGFMSRHIGVSSLGAAVVVVKDGRVVFSKGYGFADVENGLEVEPGYTVFEYGSVSKLFVYTTIMRLWEQGRIDLDADIRMYLPEGFLKKLKYDEPITMIHIMNHTTGFEDYLFDVVHPVTRTSLTMEEVLRHRQPAQVYEPGRVSSYSNYAVALAAYIAERLTGQRFSEYLTETIIRPLGMSSTVASSNLSERPEILDRKAKGYVPSSFSEFIPGTWSYLPLYPAGGMNGTAEDLAKFAMALMPGDDEESPLFEERRTLREMFTQTFSMGAGLPGYAHGFTERDGAVRGLGHSGNTAAFSSAVYLVPTERFAVIILTNAFSEMDITSGLTEELLGKAGRPAAPGEDLPPAVQVQGTYVAARRMHTGFLEMVGFLSMLEVKALDANRIEMRMAGQTATLVQTRPYVFERVEAYGRLFEHDFGKVYFEMDGGRVRRLSGDFLPLPAGRSLSWLSASLFVVRGGIAYFLGAFISMVAGKLYREVSQRKKSTDARKMRRLVFVLVVFGLLLILNNGILEVRMLFNKYWVFEEVRIHILLNYFLAIGSFIVTVLFLRTWKKERMSLVQKISYGSVVLVLSALIGVLYNWQFFRLL